MHEIIGGVFGGLFWGAVVGGIYRQIARKSPDREAVKAQAKRIFLIASAIFTVIIVLILRQKYQH